MQWQEALIIALVVIGSYLFGNINVATIITKLKRKNIRDIGSGNPGTMNMLRNFGIPLGLLTLILDILKGAVPCILGWWLVGGIGFDTAELNRFDGIFLVGGNRLGLYVAALSVIIGHVFPIALKFKGGKGIASAVGVCFVAQPFITLIMLVVGIVFILLIKVGSLGSFIIISAPLGVEGFFVSQALSDGSIGTAAGVVSLCLIFLLFSLTLFTHRKNIYQLFFGTESKTILFGKNKSVKKARQAEVLNSGQKNG